MKTLKRGNMIRKTIILMLCVLLLPVFSMADYEANMKSGMAAYNKSDFMLSYKYYYQAYKETPSVKLANILKFLKNKIVAAKAAGGQQVKAKEGGFPWKWVLVGADVVSLGLTIAAGADYNKEADKYDAMYTLLNNTTVDNYALMKAEDKIFGSKQGFFIAGVVVTAVLTAYTAADLLFIHAAFPVEAAVAYNPDNSELKTVLSYKF